MAKTVYVGGPMRGRPCFGFQEFEDACVNLTDLGYTCVSPHEIDLVHRRVEARVHYVMGRRVFDSVELAEDFDIEDTLRADFLALLNCDAIVLLPGWDLSDGACKERKVAKWAGLDVGLWDPSRNEIIWKRH